MQKIFLDANTIVSGLLFEGNESILLEVGRIGLCKLLTNNYVFEEVKNVLRRREFYLGDEDLLFLQGYLKKCIVVTDDPTIEQLKGHYSALSDKKDIPVLTGFLESKCDYLNTGDKELLSSKDAKAITTREMLKKLGVL